MLSENGLIYDASWQKNSGTTAISFPGQKSVAFTPPKKYHRLIGRWLLAFSLAILLLTYFPIMALNFQKGAEKIIANLQRKPSGFGVILAQPAPMATPTAAPLPPEEKRFQLVIPKINADSCVLANVDPNHPQSYTQALKKCVAHAKGSGLPGETQADNHTIYLFAHSSTAPYELSNSNAVFYSLKDLEVGDQIFLWFWGQKYTYLVSEKKILDNDDTRYFVPQTERGQLVLQTCYPPGTTWKQLVVIAS